MLRGIAVLTLAVVGGVFATSKDVSAFSGSGLGVEYSPFVITTCEHFQEINQDTAAYYILGGNIDCSGSSAWNSGEGFMPIYGFSGIFDGRNYTIDGLTILKGTDTDEVGVFGDALSGTVKNTYFTNIDVSADHPNSEYIGGLVGYAGGATIEGVHLQGSVTGGIVVGGLGGYLEDTTVERSSFTGDVTDTNAYGGGFAGFIFNSSVTDSFANATYVGNNVGAGFASRLLSDGAPASVTNSYFVGTSQNSNYRATFISDLGEYGSDEVTVTNSFVVASGTPDGVTPQATLPFAQKTGTPTVTDFYYDADLAGMENCGASISTCTAVNTDGLSPNYYKNTAAVAPLTEWDFTNIWQITSEYPTLQPGVLGVIGVEFAGGNGSQPSPYQITTCEQLQAMRQNLEAYYILNADIDCADTANWNVLKGFEPVGSDDVGAFTGELDGNNKTITGLYIERADDEPGTGISDESYVGLFGYTDGATVIDLDLVDTHIKGNAYVGGIVGYAVNTTISNVSVNLTTTDNSCNPGDCIWARYGYQGGGIAGYAENGTVLSNVRTGGPVKGSGNVIGGIVGELYEGELIDSYSTSNVDGGYTIGGIAGSISSSMVSGTYATGSVTGTTETPGKTGSYIGGFAGSIYDSGITDSYATGNVIGDGESIGGFGGSTGCGSEFQNVYAEGDVSGESEVGGFAGLDGCMGPGSDYYEIYATGNVTGTGDNVGGLVGAAYMTEVYEGYATGDVSSGGGFVGGLFGFLAGSAENPEDEGASVLSDTYATGNVSGQNSIGGLVGGTESYDSYGIFAEQSFAVGNVEGTHYVGGLVGNLQGGLLDETYATGDVAAEQYNVGGSIGRMVGGYVSNSYARGNVTAGESFAGGFVGTIYTGTITKNYSSGNVTILPNGAERAGGFVGEAYEDGGDIEIFNNFSVGAVSAPAGEGGFVANLNTTGMEFDNNYFDISLSQQTECRAVSGTVSGCTGVNSDGTEQGYFINNSTNPPLDEWNFASDLWQTQPNDYPCFVWQGDTEYPCSTQQDIPSDLNGDGIDDAEQPNIGGYVSPITGKIVAMDMGENCELTRDDIARESDLPLSDSAFDYENGLFDFEAECTTETTTIKLYYYDVLKDGLIFRKFSTKINGYFTVPGAVLAQETINNQTVTIVTYNITDNGDLDMNEEEGMIADPAGLAQSVVSSPNTGLKRL